VQTQRVVRPPCANAFLTYLQTGYATATWRMTFKKIVLGVF